MFVFSTFVLFVLTCGLLGLAVWSYLTSHVVQPMRLIAARFISVFMIGLSASVASAETVRDVVAECARHVGASGAYAITTDQGIPQVTAAAGGTQSGVAKVNDCLQDKYQVQYSADQVTGDKEPLVDPDVMARCAPLLNSRLSKSARGGGASDGAQPSQRYQDCIAKASEPGVESNVVALDDCGRGGNLLLGGSAYCRD